MLHFWQIEYISCTKLRSAVWFPFCIRKMHESVCSFDFTYFFSLAKIAFFRQNRTNPDPSPNPNPNPDPNPYPKPILNEILKKNIFRKSLRSFVSSIWWPAWHGPQGQPPRLNKQFPKTQTIQHQNWKRIFL